MEKCNQLTHLPFKGLKRASTENKSERYLIADRCQRRRRCSVSSVDWWRASDAVTTPLNELLLMLLLLLLLLIRRPVMSTTLLRSARTRDASTP